jgi:sialate O-acetylesterase
MQGYNSLIWPVRKFTIRGVLWYQGESNVDWPEQYADRLGILVEHWRGLFGNVPFLTVQVAPYVYDERRMAGAFIREAQFNASRRIRDCGIVSTVDLVGPLEWNQIHPENKETVGERLAFLALNRTYGVRGVVGESPAFEKMVVNGSRIRVWFAPDEGGLSPSSGVQGFEVANESKIFVPAEALRVDDGFGRSALEVWASDVPRPIAVRYCFRDFQIGNLYGHRQLPVFPFRSDNWGNTATWNSTATPAFAAL